MSIEEISYMVGHIICNPFSKHRRYKFPVDFLCVEIFIFTVEKRRCCIRTYQVSERFSNHCKTENWAILQKIIMVLQHVCICFCSASVTAIITPVTIPIISIINQKKKKTQKSITIYAGIV